MTSDTVEMLVVALLMLFIPQGFFCARERKRVCPDEKFWQWQDWVPFFGLGRLCYKANANITYFIAMAGLALGAVAMSIFAQREEVTNSFIAFGAGLAIFELFGFIFIYPYLKRVPSSIIDRIFLSLASPIGMAYYAAFIKSRKEKEKKPKLTIRQQLDKFSSFSFGNLAGGTFGGIFPSNIDSINGESSPAPADGKDETDAEECKEDELQS